jgi:F-type H+-transporting ATPase subunit a
MNGPRIILKIGSIGISETVVVSWIIIAFLAVISYLATRNLQKVPKGHQIFVEAIVGTFNSFVPATMGHNVVKFMPNIVPYIGSLFLFFTCSNLAGLVGLRSPTTDLNTTAAWAIITFLMMYVNGVRTKGVAHFKELLHPVPFMLPLNIIGELAKPISLSFRPFGNITGGTVIMALLYSFLEFLSHTLFKIEVPFLQLIIPVPLHLYFDIFAGVLQSFIFIMLTMVFVSSSMELPEDETEKVKSI